MIWTTNQSDRKLEKDMKKYIMIIALLMAISAVFAFKSGDLLFGGNFEFAFNNQNSEPYYLIGVMPQFGVFVTKNIAAELNMGYVRLVKDVEYEEDDDILKIANYGGGLRFFLKNYYAGLVCNYEDGSRDRPSDWGDYKYRALLLSPKVGVMAPLTPNIYIDLHTYYRFAVKEPEITESGGKVSNMDRFGIRAGLMVRPGSKP